MGLTHHEGQKCHEHEDFEPLAGITALPHRRRPHERRCDDDNNPFHMSFLLWQLMSSVRLTSLPVSKDNVAEIVACGRARWKIENESFNVLKNHGYELEHNFGHGQRFLAMTLAALNLLAFAW